ncbi:MAG TPA: SpoIID/LytB domain-containing protein [Armatimonadota bacterium]|jgi:stage II sporulation protein D
MKTASLISRLVLIALMFLLCAGAYAADPAGERRVTADFRNSDIRSAVQLIFQDRGLAYSLDPGVNGRITLQLVDEPFDAALSKLCSAAGLTFSMNGATYMITPAPAPRKKVRADIFPPEFGPVVRVGLTSSVGHPSAVTLSSQSDVEIADADGWVAAAVRGGSKVTISLRNGDAEISADGGQSLTAKCPLRLVPAKRTAIFDILAPSAKCKRYQGVLVFRAKEGFTVVNELPLEEYVRGVVPFEVAQSFQPEAQKALVLAIRTYALRHLQAGGRHNANGYDVCDSTDCQGFAGAFRNNRWVDNLVDGTRGQIVTFDGKPIFAVYSTDCGGATQNSEDAGFAKKPWPYLRAVADNPEGRFPAVNIQPPAPDSGPDADPDALPDDDPSIDSEAGDACPVIPAVQIVDGSANDYCAGSPVHRWTKRYTTDQLGRELSRSFGAQIGKFSSIEIAGFDSSGRVTTVVLKGDGGETRITGNRLRTVLGSGIIRSTRLTLAVTPDGEYIFSGRGFGHGVGLCSWGANGFARSHPTATYVDIIKRYYSGVEIRNLYGGNTVIPQPSPESPAKALAPAPPAKDLVRVPPLPARSDNGGSLIQKSRAGALRP